MPPQLDTVAASVSGLDNTGAPASFARALAAGDTDRSPFLYNLDALRRQASTGPEVRIVRMRSMDFPKP